MSLKNKITNAVIGYPLEHSLSPFLHKELYRRLGIDAELVKDEDTDIEKLVERIRNKPYQLTAVTMPHKQIVIPYLDEVDDEARTIGSVNMLINTDKLRGYNTDIYGIEFALREVDLKDKKVLVVGAGGVARTVSYVMRKHGANMLYINRTREKAEELVAEFGGEYMDFSIVNPNEVDIIINTTPIGMFPDTKKSPLPKEFLLNKHTVFDIIYNPLETQLLTDAREASAKTISGLDMFIAQGIRQVELWRGKKFVGENLVVEKMFEELKNILSGLLTPIA